MFDSFREPAMAGVRSGRQLARQTLYEAGDYTIDLRFEPDLDPAQVVMVGQIANRVVPELSQHSVRSSCAVDGRNSAMPSPISLASFS